MRTRLSVSTRRTATTTMRFSVPVTASLLLFFLSSSSSSNRSVQAISLLGGRYQTETDVQAYLDLALDAADMKESDDFDTKLLIYKQGSDRGGSRNRRRLQNSVTLQSLSLNAEAEMATNPYYHIFRHAFLVLGNANEGETEGQFDGAPIEVYGDTIVNDLFALQKHDIETEAALVMNVWMAAANAVFQMLVSCRAQDKEQGLAALDRAAALWIGEGQEEGSNERGHLLYNLAENAGERFDQDNGEAEVNTRVVGLLVQLQTGLLADHCDSVSSYEDVRQNAKRLIGAMTVPLVQNLIHHTMNLENEGGGDMVELYALGVIPRVAACDPSSYDDELHLDVLREMTVDEQSSSIAAIQRAYSCFGITCADVGSYLGGTVPACEDGTTITRGGYTIQTTNGNAKSLSYLDRDILQIDIFLKFNAFENALDWYTHGWNSERSLREVATNSVIPASTTSTYYSIFSSYYQDAEYANTWIESILELIPPYNSASPDQVRNAVTGILKYVVMFVATADALQFAVQTCKDGNQQSALEYADTGAMFYAGNMEGEAASGNRFGGEFLFTTAKELCYDFDTCLESGTEGDLAVPTAAVNEIVMTSISGVAENIGMENCAEAGGLVQDIILPAMMIPLIQGTLKYASYNQELLAGTDDASLSIGDAFSRGLLPLVNQTSPDSAQIIKTNMEYQMNTEPVIDGFGSVASAFRDALAGMNVQCAQVGILLDEPTAADLCSDGAPSSTDSSGSSPTAATTAPATAPAPVDSASPEGLAFGRYIFSNPSIADGDGSFALDVRDMFEATSIDQAKTVYTDGSNDKSVGFAARVGQVSLASFSTLAAQYMSNDPMFNIYKYALYDDGELEAQDFVYADDVVLEALTNGNDSKLGAEATVVLNVWMMIAHRLHAAVQICAEGDASDEYIDAAVALWIGKGQGEGKYDNGFMMYTIGQSSAKFYGYPEGEAPVNTKLMTLFVEAQTVAKSCPATPEAFVVLRSMVNEIIRTLTKPLLLSLFFHMVKNSKNMVELYAVAVVPQCATCNTKASKTLQEALFVGYDKETSLTEEIFDHLVTFMRCQRLSCDDIKAAEGADQDVVDFVGTLCKRLDHFDASKLPMAGYLPTTDGAAETARLDLDALEMYILMRTQAYGAAMDVYSHGHHSIAAAHFSTEGDTDLLTLQFLATSSSRENVTEFQEYVTYFGSATYADDIILQAIEHRDQYSTATRGQRAEIVRTTLQTMVSYMAVLMTFQSSVDNCKSGSADKARSDWDRGVALYVGSVEGIVAGGNSSGQGEWMYGLGNEVCGDFDTCETSGESTVNQVLMFAFTSVRDSLVDGECSHMDRTLTNQITARMTIPLIQGTLVKSLDMETSPESLASAHILSQAVTPLVQEVSSSSASVLSQIFGTFRSNSTRPEMSSIVAAFSDAIEAMGLECDDIGSTSDFSLCTSDGGGDGTTVVIDRPPRPETPTNLGDNLYVTTTYVQDRANIALDIQDISEALMEGNYELAKLVYKDGKNSQEYDENGKFVRTRSLKAFSIENTGDMFDEPEFNFYLYALKGDQFYADTLVENAFANMDSSNPNIPAEAAMVLNLWMEIVHMLHETAHACKKKQLRDDSGVHSMDAAVAYWIGDGQIAGDAQNGHLLYALSEKFGESFNIDDGGQSRTNTNILRLFNEAKNEVSLPNACSESRKTYMRLRRIINHLISQMVVPLIQGLIVNLRANDRERVKIYSHAFVPMVAGCSPSLFASLEDKLLNMNYNVVEVEDIINLIRMSYPCLGLECADIGVHQLEITDEVPECKDPDVLSPLAGYKPTTDVRQYARLDLDIRELDILLQMKAYEAAEELYTSGKHVSTPSGVSLSLAELATTTQRAIVPAFDAFARYYNTEKYADDIVRAALDPSKGSWTDEQRRTIVTRSSQVLIMYFGALINAYEAVSDCTTTQEVRSESPNSATWDRTAATLIGHLEGTKGNGTVEGYMFYDLAQEHCVEFGTCSSDVTMVEGNDELVTLLYTGRGAAVSNSCRAQRKAADEIAALLLVPVIQGALSTSAALSKGDDAQLRAEAYVYSRALLPLMQNRGAAEKLDEYLGTPGPSNTKHTAAEVYSALATAYPDMGVDCEDIGDAQGYDPCAGVKYDSGVSSTVWIVVGVVGGVLLLSCCCYFYMRSRAKVTKLPENNPKFVVSERGELNHSMDLLEKAFSSTSTQSRTPPSETDALNDFHDASPSEDEDFDDVVALNTKLDSNPDII